MKTYCNRTHRIRHRKDGSFAVPQWKGFLFWHDYKYYAIETVIGDGVLFSRPRTPEFDELNRALKFIHCAMENERTGAAKIGRAEEVFGVKEPWR